ncbi:MAG: hypothetical protein FWG21_05035 [Oscillospiraceae bacterium]|nr:hypothetical protein [Oscillospiraceae bacterium]
MRTFVNYLDYMETDDIFYVDVNEDRYKDGRLIPVSVVLDDGKRYTIDRIVDISPLVSTKGGGPGICYTIRIRDTLLKMFLVDEGKTQKWLMER